MFAPSFISAMKRYRMGDTCALRHIVTQEAEKVFSFSMLEPSFCETFLEGLRSYKRSGGSITRPNSMNSLGMVLTDAAHRGMMDQLQRDYLAPLAACLYPQEGYAVDEHHSFIVQYIHSDCDPPASHLGLDMHSDGDSDVTLNVCLAGDFQGGDLVFCGQRGERGHRSKVHRYQHKVGHAVLHLGNQRHGADNITSGERVNLIMWSRNSEFRASQVFWLRERRAEIEASEGFRMPSGQVEPDRVCLSRAHDSDFQQWTLLLLSPEELAMLPDDLRVHVENKRRQLRTHLSK